MSTSYCANASLKKDNLPIVDKKAVVPVGKTQEFYREGGGGGGVQWNFLQKRGVGRPTTYSVLEINKVLLKIKPASPVLPLRYAAL